MATIPNGADLCHLMPGYSSFTPFRLSIDGTLVAYTGRDLEHERDLWLGDLRDNSIRLVYKADEPDSAHKVDIWSVQLRGGRLYWLEFTHKQNNATSEVISWVVKRMDIAARSVAVVAEDKMPALGGKRYVEQILWDGERLAALVATSVGDDTRGWKIELWDPAGQVHETIDVPGDPYDFALVDDGVLFTAGIPFPKADAVGKMKLYRWTAGQGTRQIGTAAFHIAGCGDLAAWVVDDEASEGGTGRPIRPRVVVSHAPFEKPQEKSAAGHPLVNVVTCGPGIVLWWESELGPSGQDVPTVWKPEWSAPLQIVTDPGTAGTLSAGGGWIAWFEYNANLDGGRLRAIPVSVLSEANAIDPPQPK